MKRNYAKRITAGILSAVLAVGMAGCGKTAASDGSSTNESTPAGSKDGYVYQAEWLSQSSPDNSGDGYSSTDLRNISVIDDVLYYVRYNYTDNGYTQDFCRVNLKDSPAKEETLLSLAETKYDNGVVTDEVTVGDATEEGSTGTDATTGDTTEEGSTDTGAADGAADTGASAGTEGYEMLDGVNTVVAVDADTLVEVATRTPNIEQNWDDPNFDYDKYYKEVQDNTQMILKKLSMDGTVTAEEDVTELFKGQYLSYSIADGEGNVYLSDNSSIWVFDKDLTLTDTISLAGNGNNDGVNAMGVTKDGRIAILQYGTNDLELRVYDKEKKSFGDACEGLPSNMWNSGISFTEDGSVLLNNSEGAYLYDMESRTATQIVKWMDCDLTPDYVRNIYAMSDGNFVVFYEDWNTNESDIIVLKKVAAADVVQKQVVTVGVLYSSQKLQADIVEFNKNSDKYRVELKDYTSNIEYTTEDDYQKNYQNAVTQMNNDIVSGKLDMFAADSVDIENLISKGAVEDLNSYLEASTQIKKSDLMENIINAIEESGVLYCVPTSFSINTLVGRTEDVGEKSGWTMADVKALCDKYPDASLFANATSGGTDFIAIFLSEKYGIDSWNYIFAGNVVILGIAGALFGWDKALYSIIFQYTSTQVLHVLYKRYQKQTLIIVTKRPEDVYEAIAEITHHDATLIKGEGCYSKQECDVLYSVVGRDEVNKVVNTVRKTDSQAFVNMIRTENLAGRFYQRPND